MPIDMPSQAFAPVERDVVYRAISCGSKSKACKMPPKSGHGLGLSVRPRRRAHLLHMPAGADAIALRCNRSVHGFYEEPMLQHERWAKRGPLDDLLFEDAWGQPVKSPSHQATAAKEHTI